MTSEVERRHYPRVKFVTDVECEVSDHNEVFLSRDISMGGVFLQTPHPLPSDSSVQVSFRFRPDDSPIACAGRVVYSLAGVGMGIEFYDVHGELDLVLKKFLDEAN